MTALAKLLPCPFCGSENVDTEVVAPHTHKFATFMPDYKGGAMATCYACCAAHWRDGENAEVEVIAAWNRRAALSAELGGVEVTTEMAMRLKESLPMGCAGYLTIPNCRAALENALAYTTPRAAEAVTGEMVERFCAAFFGGDAWDRTRAHHNNKLIFDQVRAALTAALTPPSAKGENSNV